MDMDVVIRILMGGVLTAQSFLLAKFCKKDCDKASFWIWNVAGVVWAINIGIELYKIIFK